MSYYEFQVNPEQHLIFTQDISGVLQMAGIPGEDWGGGSGIPEDSGDKQ